MKILIVQDHLRSGGTERQSVLLANAFAAAGHATTLLTFRPGGALASTVAPVVRRAALQPFDLRLDWFAPRLFGFVRNLEPDVVLCMGRMANCYAGRLQLRQPRTAVICTMRTGKKLPRLFRRSLRLCRHVVANSRDARDTLIRDHALPPEKISVIYNSLVFPAPPTPAPHLAPIAPLQSVTQCVTLPPRDRLRSEQGASPATLVLLCVAMFRPEKNQRELIEIAATLPSTLDWQLWLAGDGPARLSCEQLAAEQNLSARVRFLGLVRDPSSLYAAADIAVHASSSESLSNFLIEAQAHGLPAIAYDAQGIGECFLPGHTGWVIARGDRAAFAAQLLALVSASPSDRATLASAANARARTTFDPVSQVAAYLDLFARLVP